MYLQLVRKLVAAIDNGEWRAGDALPSERTIEESLGISRVTARRALKQLGDDGYITRNQGSGTFIAERRVPPRFEQTLGRLDSFTEMVRPSGFVPRSELISFQRRTADPDERRELRLRADEEVVAVARLRRADQTIISLHRTTVPYGILSDAALIGDSLYSYFEEIGRPVVRARQHFNGAVADAELARIMHIAEGTPLLLVTRTAYSHDDVPIEYTNTYCLNEHYDFVVELQR
ncbi:GntR family transcriptional regulator [Pararobbsia silviterrae]|nr:GntR family transcriptional regulator [Pararobbsia silviterrae]